MRILVIPDLFPRFDGDVRGVFVLDWIACASPFAEITVLSVDNQAEKEEIAREKGAGDIQIIRLGLPKPAGKLAKALYYRRYFKKAVAAVQHEKPFDLIHAHGAILSGTVAQRLSAKWKIPFIVTEHTGPFSVISGTSWKLKWAKKVLESAHLVLCVSDHLQQEMLSAGISPKAVEVSGNPVNTSLFKLTDRKHKTILFLSRLDEFKGGLRTLKAFDKIASEIPDWSLKIVGSGEEEEAIKSYQSENVQNDRLTLRPGVPKAQIPELFAEAAFVVFPSRHESFGLVAAEALASGLPVIGPDRTGPSEFIGAEDGLQVSADDINALAAAMLEMIKRQDDFSPTDIRARIEKRFGFAAFEQKLKNWYQLQ